MKLEVVNITYPTPDSVSVHFSKPARQLIYKPGQHGIFHFTIDGKPVTRTYSFSSSPGLDQHLAITVRSVAGGLVSNHLLHNRPENIVLQQIAGDFYIEPAKDSKRHLVMFAAGSGITPIVSMIRAVLHEEPQSSVSLVYTNRSFKRIIFREELDYLSRQYAGKLTVYHVLSREQDAPEDFPVYYKDKPSKLILKKLIKGILSEQHNRIEYFMCGPSGFMALLDETFATLNIDKTKIHREHFFVPADPGLEADFSNLPARGIILHQGEQERLLVVEGGQSILEAALSGNIKLAHSCTQGQCGVCRAFLIQGEVKLKRNHILTDEELKAGQILLCQGYPMTDDVAIRPVNQPKII